MNRSDSELISKYQNMRKVLREEQEKQALPEQHQKLLNTSKALGHLEGAISLALVRLKGVQIELNNPEVSQVVLKLQDALVKAKELAPGFQSPNK
jgi:hypothetical protein